MCWLYDGLSQVWHTDPGYSGSDRRGSVTCPDWMGRGEEGVTRLESSCAIPVTECGNGRDTWHVAVWLTRAELGTGRCVSTRHVQLLQPYYLWLHPSAGHHTYCGKTEFWGIMEMLAKCLSITETVTRCHTPVMLTLASPSIVILALCRACPGQKIVGRARVWSNNIWIFGFP